MKYDSFENRADYSPALLANGDISLATGAQGTPLAVPKEIIDKSFGAYIFRAGRRLARNPRKNIHYNLLTFGTFAFSCGSELSHFTHELCLPDGYQKSVCDYNDLCRIDSRFFVHQNFNLFALEKVFYGAKRTVSYVFTYKA